jgi:hypothetical protein
MKDFEEIGHSGGMIKINIDGTKVQFEIINQNMNACSIESISIPLGGDKLPVYMVSDREGYFGAICKDCNTYFRTSRFSEITTCPYCRIEDSCVNFFTSNQVKYIEAYVNKFIKLFQSGKSGIIDFDSIIEQMNNKSSFVYSDERQQTLFKCSKCSNSNDIIGLYGYCSCCGTRNNLDIFNKKLSFEMHRVTNPKHEKSERHLREQEWQEVLKSSISIFEAFSKDVHKELLKLPMHPNQRKAVENISFQRITKAREVLLNNFQFDIFVDINNNDINFINKSFNIRHLFTHSEGIVDNDYIKNTGDSSFRLGQLVRVSSHDVKRIIELITIVAKRFANEVDMFDIK